MTVHVEGYARVRMPADGRAVRASMPLPMMNEAAVWRRACSDVVDTLATVARRANAFVAALGESRSPSSFVKTGSLGSTEYAGPSASRSAACKERCAFNAATIVDERGTTRARSVFVPLRKTRFAT